MTPPTTATTHNRPVRQLLNDPSTRETAGTIAYAALVLLITHGVLSDRLMRPRHAGRTRVFFRTALGFAIGAAVATLLAFVINALALTDFCNYLILGMATFLGAIIALALQQRHAPARRHTLVVLLSLATIEVLLIPKFLLG